MFGKKHSHHVRRKSEGRAVMLLGVVLAAVTWAGVLGPVSEAVWRIDDVLRDAVSVAVTPTPERDDLVFLGIDEECRRQDRVDPAVREASRALMLMKEDVGNQHLDRRVFAELIERLAAAGARLIIFDVLFVGSTGDPETDREFAEAINAHHERVMLALLLRPRGDGSYEPVSSREELPLVARGMGKVPHEGYVNLWPDAADGVIRRMVYRVSPGELETGARGAAEGTYESLAAAAGRLLGTDAPDEHAVRLRFAVSTAPGEGASRAPSFAGAYAPRSLHTVFVPDRWEKEFGGGEFFRDKVVLVSTSTRRDVDHHPIPGAVIHGGQFHLQALGCLLEDSFWAEAPGWVGMVVLLVMAGVALLIGTAFRHPLTILLTAVALGAGLVVLCGWISASTGVLFAGTPGLLGLALVTFFAEVGQLVRRRGGGAEAAVTSGRGSS